MILLKVFNAVINYLELFLYHGHTLSKIVVMAHLAGQLVDFGIGDCLCYLKALLHITLATAVADDHARQRDEACQYAYRASYHGYGDFCIHAAVTSSK